ncbi:MAG: MBOAT family O-acyltransferase, partial [Bacteroidota bacterium]
FWGFFAAVLGVYSLIYRQRALRNAFLFLASLFFYYKTSGFFFILLIFSTVADYLIGFLIHGAKNKARKTTWLVVSITINLLLLSYFKYSYFFTESFNELFGTNIEYYNHFNAWINGMTDSSFRVDMLLPPVGISFFTFQTISYAVDVYKGKIAPVKSILDFGFYVSFFPQLVAGPIVRAAEFIPQIYKPYRVTYNEFGLSLFWILKGLLKKMFLADFIAVNFVDRIFAEPQLYTGFENLMGLYGYSLQVYADFSGYTDIAIGIALLMGFRLPVNFNYPYKAKSVGEFWKRWHISLSTWLKDYLYIPLGGSRGSSILTWGFYLSLPIFAIYIFGPIYIPAIIFVSVAVILLFMYLDFTFEGTRQELATYANLMVTMLLGGLWHGSTWMFVIWGGLNGVGLVIYKMWLKPEKPINRFLLILSGLFPVVYLLKYIGKGIDALCKRSGVKPLYFYTFWSIFLTFNFITFTRIWFRSPDLETADLVMAQIWNNFGWEYIPQVIANYAHVFYVMWIGFVMHWTSDSLKERVKHMFIELPIYVKIGLSVVTVFLIYQAMSSDLQPFIYFQF